MKLKLAISTFFLMIALPVFGDVHVGDTTINTITTHAKDGPVATGTATIVVTSVDESQNVIKFTQTNSIGGQTTIHQGTYTLSIRRNLTKRLENLPQYCGEIGGVLQNVIVPAGTFLTCQGINNTPEGGIEYQWLSKSGLFNIVKAVYPIAGGGFGELDFQSGSVPL